MFMVYIIFLKKYLTLIKINNNKINNYVTNYITIYVNPFFEMSIQSVFHI